MTIEIKQLADQLQDASEQIKGRINGLESNFNAMDNKLKKIELKGSRPPYGRMMDDKTDPEFSQFLTKGHIPTERKELSVTNDGQGVSVRSQWSTETARLIHETSPVRQVAKNLSTNSNEIEILVDRGEPESEWTGELDPRAATTTDFVTRHKIPVYEHYAYPSVTLQMMEDSEFNVEDWLMGKAAERFTRQEASAFVNGTGSGMPTGLLSYGTVKEANFTWGATPSAYQLGAQYTGVDGDIADPDVLFDLVDSLKSAYLAKASWLMTRAFRNKVRKLKDNQDRYLLQPSLESGVPDKLLGYPVHLAEDMPVLAADVTGALFGSFTDGYTVVDRTGLTVQRDAVTQPGWIKYYVRRRIGGAVTNPEAIKALVLGTEPA
jgi:HK97 family phage major capsid protein